MKKIVIIFSLALPSLVCSTEIYKQVDAATGEITYTNFHPKKPSVVVVEEFIQDWVPPKIKPEKKSRICQERLFKDRIS